MRHSSSLAAAVLLLVAAGADAQTNIKPDTTPRLPPQAGQGLPLEDRQFLLRVANLNQAEIEAGKLAAEKAANPAVKEFAGQMVGAHQKLSQSVEQLAKRYDVALEPHASRDWWRRELARIGGLSGQDFEREYMRWQLQTHLTMVNLLQTQASHSTQTDLSRFAIITLNEVQRHFEHAKQLGAQYGVAIDTVKQPPQY